MWLTTTVQIPLSVGKVGIVGDFSRFSNFPIIIPLTLSTFRLLAFLLYHSYSSIHLWFKKPTGCHPVLKPWTWLATGIPSSSIQLWAFSIVLRNLGPWGRTSCSRSGTYRDTMRNFGSWRRAVALDPGHIGTEQRNFRPRSRVNCSSGLGSRREASTVLRHYGSMIVDETDICGLLVEALSVCTLTTIYKIFGT